MEEMKLHIYTKTGILLETIVGKLKIEKDEEQKCYTVFGEENEYVPIVKISSDDVIIILSINNPQYSRITHYLCTLREQY